MESEKVKDIKEALQQEIHLVEYVDEEFADCVSLELLKDILTLINDLDSENEELLKAIESLNGSWKMQLKKIAELESKNKMLTGERDLYKNQFNELEPRFFDLREENKELKDRLAELEKENLKLANIITCQVVLPDDKLEEIKKECLEKVELAKEKLLKQFAERWNRRVK